MARIIKHGEISTVTPITDDLEGWVVTEGTPSMKTWIMHSSEDGTMISGYWEATPGTYHATYTDYEFVHLIQGEIVIAEDGKKPITLRAGDAFVVEAGFSGSWKIVESVRKHFDIRLK